MRDAWRGARRPGAVLSLGLLFLTTTGLAGCLAGAVECSSGTGHYRCDIGGARDVDREDEWDNPHPRARVEVSAGGRVELTVTLLDAVGDRVFHETFDVDGGSETSQTSETGTPGTWTVRIEGEVRGGVDVEVRGTA